MHKQRKLPNDERNNVRCLCVLYFSFVNVIRFLSDFYASFVYHALAYAGIRDTRVTRPLGLRPC